MTLDEARACIGRSVVYTSGYGPPEEGVITSVSKTFVFVQYAGQLHSKGTAPENLTLMAEVVRESMEAAGFPLTEESGTTGWLRSLEGKA